MRNKANRLTKDPGPIVAVRADSDFSYLLDVLIGKGAESDGFFQSQSEAIYHALYDMANRIGIKTPLGERYETLSDFHRSKMAESLLAKLKNLNDESDTRRRQAARIAIFAG